MIVKIIIERKFKEAPRADDIRVLNELRVRAMGHEGYVSGETLVELEDNRKMVILSVWASVDDWESWANSKERRKLEAELNPHLEEPAIIRSFILVLKWLSFLYYLSAVHL